MTVNEDVPGIQVDVVVDGHDVAEYDPPDAPDDDAYPPTVTKYIECLDKARFAVRTTVSNEYLWGYRNHSLVLDLRLDGKCVRSKYVRCRDTVSVPYSHFMDGRDEQDAATGEWFVRKFKFASIRTVDDARKDRVDKDTAFAKDLGIIELKVRRVIEMADVNDGISQRDSQANFELAEKSLKGRAISHGVAYGSARRIAAPRFRDCVDIVEDGGPIAVYRFLYRSREALRNELIIPRSPEPRSPTMDALSEADIRRLARERLAQMNDVKPNVKNEGDGRRSRRVKREHSEVDLTGEIAPGQPAKRTKRRSGEIEVIDLTDD